MKGSRAYVGLGALLIVLGILFLLQNFNLLGSFESILWLAIFGIGGLVFLWVFFSNREQWWAIIPGFTLLGLALLVGFGDRLGAWGGAIFLGAIGLSFWVIYVLRRDFWWAIIPGGALVTLALVAGLSDLIPNEDTAIGGVLFLGLALTFLLVYLAPTPQGHMKWALYPAGILAVMGILMIMSLGGYINYAFALAMILGGGFLIARVLRK